MADEELRARQRRIVGSTPFTIPGTLLVVGAAYALLPPLRGQDTQLDRLVLALRWLVVAMLPYVAVCGHIAAARLLEGAHDPTRGEESPRLKIHCRVMQNTLEQLVWFAVCLLAVATFLSAAEVRLVPIVAVAFALARGLYWWGYLRSGTLGRAPGVQATFTLNGALLILTLVLAVTR
jgi:uncharacterized membrane protein YecN with MAPEG domain